MDATIQNTAMSPSSYAWPDRPSHSTRLRSTQRLTERDFLRAPGALRTPKGVAVSSVATDDIFACLPSKALHDRSPPFTRFSRKAPSCHTTAIPGPHRKNLNHYLEKPAPPRKAHHSLNFLPLTKASTTNKPTLSRAQNHCFSMWDTAPILSTQTDSIQTMDLVRMRSTYVFFS